jgi:hypothetical protein
MTGHELRTEPNLRCVFVDLGVLEDHKVGDQRLLKNLVQPRVVI